MRKSERVRRRACCVLREGGCGGGAGILNFGVNVVVFYGCRLFRVFMSLKKSISREYTSPTKQNPAVKNSMKCVDSCEVSKKVALWNVTSFATPPPFQPTHSLKKIIPRTRPLIILQQFQPSIDHKHNGCNHGRTPSPTPL